jgi:hypothetical protein
LFSRTAEVGSCILGPIQVANPVAIKVGTIFPLHVFSVNYFISNVLHSYRYSKEDLHFSIFQICLNHAEVVQKAREYYDSKRRNLQKLYQDLAQLKHELTIFFRPNNLHKFDFSFEYLSQIESVTFFLKALPDLSQELILNFENKQSLLALRDGDLLKMQETIFDIHLKLAFHLYELIERRDQGKKYCDEIGKDINRWVKVWNQNISSISNDIAYGYYESLFIWKEMLANLSFKIEELNFLIGYYEKLKTHFFVTQTTNFLDVFATQKKINKAILENITSNMAIWWLNIQSVEDVLRSKNLLSHQLVNYYENKAKQYRKDIEKNGYFFAQNKKNA